VTQEANKELRWGVAADRAAAARLDAGRL